MIVDKASPKKGIIEMRPIDAAKIKKIAKVEKESRSQNWEQKQSRVSKRFMF